MFIVLQKREEIRAVEKDNRREEEKKKEEKDLIGDVNVVTFCTGVCSNHALLLFFLLVFVLAEFLFSTSGKRLHLMA